MVELPISITVDGATVSGIIDRPENCRPGVTPGLVLGHGANNDLTHPLLAIVAEHLADTGVANVLRFNFPYMQRGASSPDRLTVLEETLRRAHDVLFDDPDCAPGPLFLGGKSLGARVAASLVSRHHEAEGLLASGLIFLGYPLHAPGGRDNLKLEPLRRIDVPSLFVVGTRDPFCDIELLKPIVAGLDMPGTLHLVPEGGHSFEMPKSSGRTDEESFHDVAAVVAGFIEAHTA